MSNCPRCHQPIDSQAIACPYCRVSLKAFGHPGIPIYHTQTEEYLCNSCIYHFDDTCNFPQRPYAKNCTLYHDQSEPLVPPTNFNHISWFGTVKFWLQRNTIWWLLLSLVLISLIISF
ncbi:MAG: zinc ribbon domain-containing protein [Cyanobacteriota bacterium]|nr:zinc ribbon domain-containing protein [Cyanobacteriota bacterium]